MNTSFRDSTTFLVQARTKRGFAGVDIVIDTPQYPIASHKSPFHDGTANVYGRLFAQHPRPILHGRWNESVQSERSGSHWKSTKRPVQKVFTQEVSTPTRSRGTDWKDSVHKQLLMQSPDFRALA